MNHTRSRLFASPLIASLVIGASLVGAAALHRTADSAPTAAAAPVSVAFCDVAKVINSLKEFEKERGMHTIKQGQLRAKLQETRDQLEKIDSDLKNNKFGNNPLARAEAIGQRNELQGIYKTRQEVYELQLDFAVADSFNRLYGKAVEAVQGLAKREGIDIVLLDDRAIKLPALGNARTDDVMKTMENKRVMYAREGLDITDRVINLMNDQFTAGANEPAPAAPAPAKNP